MKRLKQRLKRINLRNLDFNTLFPLLVGVLLLLFIIYIIFFRPDLSQPNENVSPATSVEELEQFHRDKTFELLQVLPQVDEDYIIQKERVDDKDYIIIYHDTENLLSLDKAYLFLKQYGIFKGDARIQEKELIHEEVGPPGS